MLKRKIEHTLLDWKNTPKHKPLIIKGCRQCGKTMSVLAFSKENYEHVIYLNFFENPEYAAIFSGSLQVDTLVMMITALLGAEAVFTPGKTIVIFDEIQKCPEARTSLKFWHLDGRYDVIATGSLSGVNGYGKEPASIPVGYETAMEMVPMDFEEFLWANKITPQIIDLLKNHLTDETAVPDAIHARFRQLLLQYTVVGGMPEAVQTFVDTKQMNQVLQIQRDIVRSYEDDMVKYAEKKDKAAIRECFRSVPKQLAKENKKFQYSVVSKGSSSSKFTGSLQWLEDTGIIRRCYNVDLPEPPLDGNAIDNQFKVYMQDTGLFISMLEDGTQIDILTGKLYGYKGAILENLIADIFSKAGRKLYYFHKDSGLELDFLIRLHGECVPIEVKAETGNAKSLKTVLAHPEKYHVNRGIKFGDYNIGHRENILMLPMYMSFLIADRNTI